MDSNIVINQVIVLFLIMAVGFILRKVEIVDKYVSKKLSSFLLKITLPFMVIISFQFEFSPGKLKNLGFVFICSLLIHASSILLARYIFIKIPDSEQKVLKFATVFSNCAFMGFPVLHSLYGNDGIFYGSAYIMVFNILIWTYGILVFQKGKKTITINNILLNPGIISVIIGILLFITSTSLPYPIYSALDMVGSMTTPISMIIIGGILADIDFKKAFSGFSLYYGSFIRLLIIPLIVLAILKLTPLDDLLLGICVVSSAMPAAANTAIFAEMYEGDSLFASRLVGISTLLSIITIPLIIVLL